MTYIVLFVFSGHDGVGAREGEESADNSTDRLLSIRDQPVGGQGAEGNGGECFFFVRLMVNR